MRPKQNDPVWDVEADVDVKMGQASSDVSTEPEMPITTLWLRDPEQGSGWREYHVWRKKQDKPKTGLGFRKHKS